MRKNQVAETLWSYKLIPSQCSGNAPRYIQVHKPEIAVSFLTSPSLSSPTSSPSARLVTTASDIHLPVLTTISSPSCMLLLDCYVQSPNWCPWILSDKPFALHFKSAVPTIAISSRNIKVITSPLCSNFTSGFPCTFRKNIVLLGLGCYDNMPQTGWLTQQKFIS